MVEWARRHRSKLNIAAYSAIIIAGVSGYTKIIEELGELRATVKYEEMVINDLTNDYAKLYEECKDRCCMSGVGKSGDIWVGICVLHEMPTPYTATAIDGSDNTHVNSSKHVVNGSMGIATCGHVVTAITGSSTIRINSKGGHRMGDIAISPGGPCTLVTGSDNTREGG